MLARPVHEALQQIRDAFAVSARPFDPAQSARTFRVAGVDFADLALVPGAVATIRQEAPNVTIELTVLHQSEAIACLEDGTIDLAVGSFSDPPKRMGILPIREDPLVCVARQGHPALNGAWTAQDFAALPHLVVRFNPEAGDPVDTALEAIGLKRSIALSMVSYLMVPFIIRSSDLVTCASEAAARVYVELGGLQIRPPPIALPPRRISMVWSRKTENAFGLQWLRERVIEIARRHKAPARADHAPARSAPA
jgi:DNA-binding transcriptional LysR family regulator